MTGKLIDQAVRDRVGRTGLGDTLFVEAGAGSGKTTLLVERIVNLVLEADVSLASIAAITFTEAAATELQTRIRARFERELATAKAEEDHERSFRCRQAIADTDLAVITTLHGFANRILGEFAVAAGLPPQIRVLDEVSSQLAQEDRWQQFVDRLYDSAEHVDLLQLASALNIVIEPRYRDQVTLRTVAVEFNQNWDRLKPFAEADRGELNLNVDFGEFDGAVAVLADWPASNTAPDDKLNQHLHVVLAEMSAISEIQDPLRKLRALKGARKWGPGTGGAKGSWQGGSDTVASVKSAIKDVSAAVQDVLDPLVDDVLMRLSQLIATEIYEAAEARRTDGGLEFHDLLVLARDVVRTKPDARNALHERYQYLLLDEFQDTDPIQVELAVLIATSAADVGTVPWWELPVDPSRLFFVGDPKQSIYRFRRADIALFLEARDRFAGEDGSSQLRTNFRTVEPIVHWVNAFFDHEMAEELPGQQPKYQPLVANRTLDNKDDLARHRPVLLGGPHADPKVKAAPLREAEADDVAGIVRAIVADPEAWPVFDTKTKQWRPARLDDITILLPTRTSLSFLRSALDEADLRYRIATGTLVYDTQEVVDALAALRAIDDPGDELSLVTALRSPLYGCSDTDLLVWRSNGGRWDVRSAIPESIAASHPVAQAIEHLKSLWTERWFLTPSAILERLLRDRKATLLAFGDPRTVDVWRRLRFLIEQARAFEEADSGDLRAFVQWAALQGGSMARVHEPVLPETDEAALNIQTIHGSKGLEFPITILSGMTTQRSNRKGMRVLWSDDGDPSISLNSDLATAAHGARADLESAMDVFEKMRLAYVATTRARDHLIVSCHHKDNKSANKTYGGLFWQVFDHPDRRGLFRFFDWREVVGKQEPEPVGPDQLGLALDTRDQWIIDRQVLLAPSRLQQVMSATGVAQAALRSDAISPKPDALEGAGVDPGPGGQGIDDYLAEQLVEQDDDRADQPVEPLVGRRRGRTGSAIGSAVHAVLQLLDLAEPQNTHDLVMQQCEIEGIPDRDGIVRRLVEAALSSTAVQTAAANPHHKELFVAAPVDGRVIEGYVDLLVETPDGLVVIDYKTDSVRSEADVDAKLAGYELQAAAYAVALETVTGAPVIDCRFVFCTANGPIERSVVELETAKARVRSTLDALG